jgi:hypothetical protein
MALIPKRAISEDVSNPKPKRTPRGYIFHGLRIRQLHPRMPLPQERTYRSISLNVLFNALKRQPPPSIWNSGSGASAGELIITRSCLMSLYKMNTFMIPSTIRKVAETLLPMIPPTLENAPNRVETAAAVEATTIDVITTILGID